MKKYKILVLMHEDFIPPTAREAKGVKTWFKPWRTEFDIVNTLKKTGHEVHVLGVWTDLALVKNKVEEVDPDIVFNLLEEFHGESLYDQNVVSFLELLRVPYTGCNPRGMMLARDKALCKKILHYHRIPVPDFLVIPIGRKVRRPKKLEFPLIVKSLVEESSLGIAQASVVYDDNALYERAQFIHEKVGTDAIAEQFIDGREFYVAVYGNTRLKTLPVWELNFKKIPEGASLMATRRVKWDFEYQKKYGIKSRPAADLSEAKLKSIQTIAGRVYKTLGLNGYARIDMRMKENGDVFVLEANPNPELSRYEDFAESAKRSGIQYADFLDTVVRLGLRWSENRSG